MLQKRFFKTKDEVEVTFSIPGDGHSEAALLCDMHDWAPIPMKRTDRGKGPFRTRIRIPKDTEVQFHYLSDGCVWKTTMPRTRTPETNSVRTTAWSSPASEPFGRRTIRPCTTHIFSTAPLGPHARMCQLRRTRHLPAMVLDGRVMPELPAQI